MSWTTGVLRRVLPNGLTLLAQRDSSARVVAVVTHVKAGYFDEPDEWVGVAHVLEHMFFKGTARRGPGAIARETQGLGGYLNAATSYDQTVYVTVLPATDGGLARALDIQADALMHTALDPQELARELEVIVQEAKRKLDTPRALATETLYELLFTTHRMRRWRIGTEAGLRRLRAEDVRGYHDTRYAPERCIVALVGELDPERALDLASQTYGGWQRPSPPIPPSPPEPAERRAAFRVLRGDVARPLAAIGWRTVGTLHPDAVALDAAAQVLGVGRGSRLWRGVRLPGLATSVSASHYTPTEVGVLQLSVEAQPGRMDQAVGRGLALTAHLAAREPPETELQRVRSLTQAHWARRFESMDGRAATLCAFEALGDYRLADAWYQRALEVTPGDLRRVAQQYLAPEVAGGVLYLPPSGTTTLERAWPPSVSGVEQLGLPHLGARGTPRHGLPARAVRYPGDLTLLPLANAHLLVRSKPGAGIVALGVYVPGLRDTEAAEQAGLATLLLRGTLRGAGGLGADALAFASEMLGGSVDASADVDVAGWSVTVPSRSAREAAALLRTLALEAALDEEELRAERALQADHAARARDDMFRHPLQEVLRQAWGPDPYGQPALGQVETVARLDAAQVHCAARLARRRQPLVVAVGDLETSELLDCLSPVADWPADAVAWTPPGPPTWTRGRGEEPRDTAQTALAMAFPAPDATSPDRFALEVIAAVLSGLAGRLFEALRERRSLAYSVTMLPWLRRRGGAALAYVATSPERENEARDGMLEQLGRLAREPLPLEELQRARAYTAGLVEIRRQHGGALAGELVGAWISGTLEEFAELPRRLRSVTAEDVARVAESVFQPASRAEYVVRGTGRSR